MTWLLTTGSTGTSAPGISEAGIPATEATLATDALLTDGDWLYE